jgi:pimeloyl-ACP methyl ester carboxylesterase
VKSTPLWHRITTRAGAVLDSAALKIMEAQMSRSAPRRGVMRDARARLIELATAYGRPEHFARADTFFKPPAEPRVIATQHGDSTSTARVHDLRFASAFEPFLASYRDEYLAHLENRTAHARWLHGPSLAQAPRPTLILLHGWGGGSYPIEQRAFVATYWCHAGFDVVLFQLPFHGQRAPRSGRSGALFPSPHVARTNEAFAHAVHDLRALMLWLRAQGTPAIGALGMSLGGYTTALLASVEPTLAFAVPMIPAVSMSELMWRHGDKSRARRRAVEAGVTQDLLDAVFRVHAPLARPPLVPHDRRFLIAGEGDRITPPDQPRALWEHWGRPPIHWFPGGHLIQAGRSDAFRALRRWFAASGLV